MENKFESTVRHIPYSQQAVYDRLSDLSNIEAMKEQMPADKAQSVTSDKDSVTVSAAPVGNITLRIAERQEPKCIKMEAEQSPLPFTLWIQIVAEGEDACKIKLTIKAELNPFISSIVSKPLQDAVEHMAETIAAATYE